MKINVNDYNFRLFITNCGLMVIMIKKNILSLKWRWIKNNFETTVTNCGFKENCKTIICNCGFKDISFKTTVSKCGSKRNCKTTVCNCGFKDIFVSFKTTITNGGFLHLKFMWMLTWIKKITLTNILKWILFLPFFFTNKLFWS